MSRVKLFRDQTWAAFDAMQLRADYVLPPAVVLSRAPVDVRGLQSCPQQLWTVIQAHGGFVAKGRLGVSRKRIIYQLNKWKKARFQMKSTTKPDETVDSLIIGLLALVPPAAVLVDAARMLYESSATCPEARPITNTLRWTGENLLGFWEEQRVWLINTFSEASCHHAGDCSYLDKSLHADDRCQGLRAALVTANPNFDPTHCTTCSFRECNCLEAMASEVWDTVIKMFTCSIAHSKTTNTQSVVSPPRGASLPVRSAKSLYKIAGTLLCKMKKQRWAHSGAAADVQRAFDDFSASHSITQSEAMSAGLPTGNVKQRCRTSPTYVSYPLYQLFCKLEPMFRDNLTEHNLATGGANVALRLREFARQDEGVQAAWDCCVQHVREHLTKNSCSQPQKGHAGWNTVEDGLSFVFDEILKQYMNVCGQEFVKRYNKRHSVNRKVPRSIPTRQLSPLYGREQFGAARPNSKRSRNHM